EIAGGNGGSVLDGLDVFGDELALSEVVINAVLIASSVGHGGVAEPAAPGDQVFEGSAVMGSFGGYLREKAVLGELKRFFRIVLAIGKFVLDAHSISGWLRDVEPVVQCI